MAKNYHIVVFGCQMNIADAEKLSAVFENMGFEKTENENQANIIAVVMCSVRQPAVDRIHWLAHKFQKMKADNPELKTILTGCILDKDKKTFEKSFDYVAEISKISEIVRQQIRSVPRKAILPACRQAWHGSPKAKNCRELSEPGAGWASDSEELLSSGYVPIMTGCNNFCSYCVVPYTRGREVSRPSKEIISEVKQVLKKKVKQIWLLGQNVNSYKDPSAGLRQSLNFPKLLKLINDIPGNFELNFTSSHPKDFSDELVKTLPKCEKLSKHLNLPIQSGDDEILSKMNRPYTVEQYKKLAEKIRKAFPNVLLSTDVIVGFPGETKKQFENTVKIFKEIGFSLAFINKYSSRPGTAAAKLKDNVSWAEKKRREKILIDLINKK